MGKKGESKALKRKPAPGSWPIPRKEFTWVVKPSSGPHPLEECLPLAIVLRDILEFAKTRKEAKTIVSQGKVHVDGKVRREEKFPVGLMDVISVIPDQKSFRVLPSNKGLTLCPITEKESTIKLCRIKNKTLIKKGAVQLNLHDGTNILLKTGGPENPQGDIYKTLNTLKLSLPEREILDQIAMKENNIALITGGKNIGKYGEIIKIEEMEEGKRKDKLVTIEDQRGNHYQTILDYIFVIGGASSLISLPEAT